MGKTFGMQEEVVVDVHDLAFVCIPFIDFALNAFLLDLFDGSFCF
jgi:hypothetical protein